MNVSVGRIRDFLIKDDNIDFSFNGEVDLTGKNPEFDFDASVQKLDLKKLNLSQKNMILSGKINLSINPDLVGGQRRFLMSEVSGRRMILEKIWEVDASITKDDAVTDSIIKRLKELEHEGYQFEGAESTFELVIRKQLGKYRPFFELEHFKIIGEQPTNGEYGSSAIIKVRVDGTDEITAAEGDGPVHALDCALRKALDKFFPELSNVHLTDYKVRVINGRDATAAKVRVLLQSTDGDAVWTTVGVSTDIIEASWIALVDSIEYKLLILEEAKCPM